MQSSPPAHLSSISINIFINIIITATTTIIIVARMPNSPPAHLSSAPPEFSSHLQPFSSTPPLLSDGDDDDNEEEEKEDYAVDGDFDFYDDEECHDGKRRRIMLLIVILTSMIRWWWGGGWWWWCLPPPLFAPHIHRPPPLLLPWPLVWVECCEVWQLFNVIFFNTLATSPFFDLISMQTWKRIVMFNHLGYTTATFQIFAPSPQHRRPPRQSRLWKPTLCQGSLFPGNKYIIAEERFSWRTEIIDPFGLLSK